LNAAGASAIAWEDNGFVNSGHALVFGSRSADRRVTWIDNLNLNSAGGITSNYNLREIRVTDNPLSSTDSARMSGIITGTIRDDLVKTGAGTLELTGANTYRGTTFVHEGTLIVNSPGTLASGLLTEVHAGATLAGNGTVGAVKVAIGGRIAPGSAVTDTGTLSTGALWLEAAPAHLSLQLGGNGPGAYDQVAVTGTVTLNGATLAGSLLNGFAPTDNDLFFIIINDGTDPVDGKFVDGDFVVFGNTIFEISYTGDSATNSLTGGNDVVLHMVPEPSAAMLGIGGMALLVIRRRRT
jgi:autotransporter-associated beta strand protein